jgi:hypothetical protein
LALQELECRPVRIIISTLVAAALPNVDACFGHSAECRSVAETHLLLQLLRKIQWVTLLKAGRFWLIPQLHVYPAAGGRSCSQIKNWTRIPVVQQ